MVVSVVQSIDIFCLSQVKKWLLELCSHRHVTYLFWSGLLKHNLKAGEIEWMNMADLWFVDLTCDRKIEEEQNRFDVMTRF